MKDADEFSFLEETFKSLGSQYFDTSGIIIGPGDDAGLVENNKETIYSVDASVSGIHFPENLSPHFIAYRSVSTAASDIAACGGSLKWILISLTVSNKDLSWMRGFVSGLKNFSDDYSCPVLGGDLSKGAQENISVTVCGELNKGNFLKRGGAKEGDSIFLTGTLGQAKKGLEHIEKNIAQIDFSSSHVKKFLSPKLNFEFAKEQGLLFAVSAARYDFPNEEPQDENSNFGKILFKSFKTNKIKIFSKNLRKFTKSSERSGVSRHECFVLAAGGKPSTWLPPGRLEGSMDFECTPKSF